MELTVLMLAKIQEQHYLTVAILLLIFNIYIPIDMSGMLFM